MYIETTFHMLELLNPLKNQVILCGTDFSLNHIHAFSIMGTLIPTDCNETLVICAVQQLTTVFCAVGSLFIVKPRDMLTAKPGAVLKALKM